MWNGLAPLLAVAFSGGGGDGFDGAGLPLLQSCDAINVCRVPCVKHNGIPCWVDPTTGVLRNARLPGTRDNGMVVQELVCPNGMTAVAPPERSPFLVAAAVDKNDDGIDDGDNNNGDDNNSTNITDADNHC